MQRRSVRIAVAAFSALLVLSGCGDADEDAAGDDSTTTTPADSGGDTDSFCEDLISIQGIEPEIPEGTPEAEEGKIQEKFFKDQFLPKARRIRDAAPSAIKDDATELVRLFQEKGPAAFEDDRFRELNRGISGFAVDECGAEKLSVKAVDYAFEGVPATIKAGRAGFIFENSGTELHEMIILRKNDGTKESFDELVKLPEGEARQKVTGVGGSFAFPGKEDIALVDLEPGEYAMVCFIPVGLTPEKAQSKERPDGPPHVARGMKHEFKVA